MAYRTVQVFIQSRTMKRLRLMQKLYPAFETDRTTTTDEMADEILNTAITNSYPEVIELEKKLADIEKQYVAEIRQKKE
jgi:hypothetical protein